jgi:hypothetical protein
VRGVLLAGLVAAGLLAATAEAYFTAAKTSAQPISAATDFLPPSASRAEIAGETPGNVTPGQRYRVYAQVDDQGNPPAGVRTVTADVSSLTSGATAVSLTPGSYSVGSATYNYGSGNQTAKGNLSPGSKPYTLTTTDALGQAATQSYSVSVGPQCQAASITTDNGGHPHVVDRDDQIFFAFTGPIDTTSIISYWTAGGVGVTILIADRGANDDLTIVNQSTGQATPLGTVAMDGDFARSDVRFGGVIQMQSASTAVVRIGDLYGGTGQPLTEATKQTMTWSPSPGITDTNGSPCSTTPVTQPKPIHNF